MAPGEGTDSPRTRSERSVTHRAAHRAAAQEAILAVLSAQGQDWRSASEVHGLAQSRLPVGPPTVRQLLIQLEREGRVESRKNVASDRRVRGRWWRLQQQDEG